MDSSSSNSNNHDTDLNRRRKKRRKIHVENNVGEDTGIIDSSRWRKSRNEDLYSRKLLEALQRNDNGGGRKDIRDTADRVLATTSKGKTRWSRAILTNQLSMRLHLINRKHKRAKTRTRTEPKKTKKKEEEVPLLEQKVRVLGRVVPGCRKVAFPSLLEETTDYIAALEMQVRAMTFLTQLLTPAPDGGALAVPPPPTHNVPGE